MTHNKSYAVVFIYQKKRDEDSVLIYDLYKQFEESSCKAIHIVTGNSFLKSFALALLVIVYSTLTRGTCFLASIDSLLIALALRLCPLARLETFDDGSANILHNSKYFTEQNHRKSGLKGAIIQFFFPRGWAFWMRKFTSAHHTVYPESENIVDRKRLKFLNWDWENLLIAGDIKSLDESISLIVLGTCFVDHPSSDRLQYVAQELARTSDLYIKHPRESSVIKGENVKAFRSPAEALLIHLSKKNKLKVIHFNSSTAYSLEGAENICFENIIDPVTKELKLETAPLKQQIFEPRSKLNSHKHQT